ncbi:MAG: NUDIX domain-containing protein [Alphaproteobacteria bacterium]|nr:NUDIX domain-containing protein [Alphaproteobacteria bacterium]
MAHRLTMVIGVHLILRRGDKTLLARRHNTGYADGFYNLPCGHLDPGESVKAGLCREVREEIGIDLSEEKLQFAGCTHWLSTKQSVNFFFEYTDQTPDPVNLEPDKCDDISWFDLKNPPPNLVKQTALVITAYAKNKAPFFIDAEE